MSIASEVPDVPPSDVVAAPEKRPSLKQRLIEAIPDALKAAPHLSWIRGVELAEENVIVFHKQGIAGIVDVGTLCEKLADLLEGIEMDNIPHAAQLIAALARSGAISITYDSFAWDGESDDSSSEGDGEDSDEDVDVGGDTEGKATGRDDEEADMDESDDSEYDATKHDCDGDDERHHAKKRKRYIDDEAEESSGGGESSGGAGGGGGGDD